MTRSIYAVAAALLLASTALSPCPGPRGRPAAGPTRAVAPSAAQILARMQVAQETTATQPSASQSPDQKTDGVRQSPRRPRSRAASRSAPSRRTRSAASRSSTSAPARRDEEGRRRPAADPDRVAAASVADEAGPLERVRHPVLPLHLLLQEHYEGLSKYADTIAERLLAVGVSADGRANTIVKTSGVPEIPGGFLDDAQILVWFTNAYKRVGEEVHAAIKTTEDVDPTTSNLLQEVEHGVAKYQWQMRAQLQRTQTDPNTGWDLNDNKPVDLQGQKAPARRRQALRRCAPRSQARGRP